MVPTYEVERGPARRREPRQDRRRADGRRARRARARPPRRDERRRPRPRRPDARARQDRRAAARRHRGADALGVDARRQLRRARRRASSRSRCAGPIVTRATRRSTISLHDALEGYDAQTRDGLARYLGGLRRRARRPRARTSTRSSPRRPTTLERLEGAMRAVAPSLGGVHHAASSASTSAVAPVAEEQAGFFRGLDRTFGALASVAGDVEAATAEAPAALAGRDRRASRAQRGLVRETTKLFAAVRPGLRAARGARDDIAGAATGSPAAFAALADVVPAARPTPAAPCAASPPPAPSSPRSPTLQDTMAALAPTAADLRDAQVVCNYGGRAAAQPAERGQRRHRRPATGSRRARSSSTPARTARPARPRRRRTGPRVENRLHTTPAPARRAPPSASPATSATRSASRRSAPPRPASREDRADGDRDERGDR